MIPSLDVTIFHSGIVILPRCDNLGRPHRLTPFDRRHPFRKHRFEIGSHENQRNPPRKRTRSPARSVSRGRQLGDFPGSHSRQCRELDHHTKLRFQRRRGSVRFHFGIYRLLRLRADDDRTRLHRRRHPPDQARLAALCRAHHPVRHLHRFDRIRRAALQRSRDHQRVQRGRSGRQCRRDIAPGAAAEIQAGQPRRASALHRADGIFPAGAVDDVAPAQSDDAGIDRAVARGPAVRLEFTEPIPPEPGTSTRIAGRCCSCSARGARWAARDARWRSSCRRSPSISASPI